jgi:hypothetical protein
MAALSPLGVSALRLRNASPDAFEQFLHDLAKYKDQLTAAVTTAPVGEVLVAQGRAQSIIAIEQVLKECHLPRPEKPTPPVPRAHGEAP